MYSLPVYSLKFHSRRVTDLKILHVLSSPPYAHDCILTRTKKAFVAKVMVLKADLRSDLFSESTFIIFSYRFYFVQFLICFSILSHQKFFYMLWSNQMLIKPFVFFLGTECGSPLCCSLNVSDSLPCRPMISCSSLPTFDFRQCHLAHVADEKWQESSLGRSLKINISFPLLQRLCGVTKHPNFLEPRRFLGHRTSRFDIITIPGVLLWFDWDY